MIEDSQITDYHIHSVDFSDGKMHVGGIVEKAVEKGYQIGIADHASRHHLIKTNKDLEAYIVFLDKFPVYKAIEFDLGDEIQFSKDLLRELDYVISGVHYLTHRGKFVGFWDPNIEILDFDALMKDYLDLILRALDNQKIDILAHPTLLPLPFRHYDNDTLFRDYWVHSLIVSAVEHNVVLEINDREKLPHRGFLEECIRQGAVLAMASDGHKAEEVCQLDYALEMVAALGISLNSLYRCNC